MVNGIVHHFCKREVQDTVELSFDKIRIDSLEGTLLNGPNVVLCLTF